MNSNMNMKVGIIGAGATARSAVAACRELAVKELAVTARRAQPVADVIQLADRMGLSASATAWSDKESCLNADLVISTLPGDAAAELTSRIPREPDTLLDVTYSPWPTTLADGWQAAGGTVAPGYRMLLWQAAAQVELMTRLPAPVQQMSHAQEAVLFG